MKRTNSLKLLCGKYLSYKENVFVYNEKRNTMIFNAVEITNCRKCKHLCVDGCYPYCCICGKLEKLCLMCSLRKGEK